jgi:ATPase subunit of ABC transporter with duplicated ATPase domains
MAHLLGAESVSMAYPNRVVLAGVSLGMATGDRIGIVGRNGDGKSTLLALLAGRLQPDSGRVTQRRGLDIGYLTQDDELNPADTVRDAIVGDLPEYRWAGSARVRSILGGLVSDIDLESLVGELSGGQRRRVALASVLIGNHDVLFLDEPTNHLDLEAITWLADHLNNRWPTGEGAAAIVTHDRWFLDAVCTTTWEVHDGIVEPFEGGYAAYILQRVERDRQAAAAETKRRNILRKELAWLSRGARARTSKPKFRLDAAAELIANEPPARDQVELKRLATARLGKDVIDILNVDAGYDDSPDVVSNVTWLIGPGDRLGLLGPNGAGKTTLLSLISGTLKPRSGKVKRGKTVQVATLSQDLRELGPYEDSTIRVILEELKRDYSVGGSLGWTGGGRNAKTAGGDSGEQITPTMILERLGFTPAHFATPVSDLSGGQRRRLQLALVLMAQPNVLILDEPSNDLDTDMLAAMEDLLDSWPGTLIVVSHDRYLMERVTDAQYALVDAHLRHLPGGIEEYLRIVGSSVGQNTDGPTPSLRPPSRNLTGTVSSGIAGPARNDGNKTSAEVRAIRKEIAAVERKLTKLRADVADNAAAITAASQSDYQKLAELSAHAQALQTEIAEQEDRWLALSESLEA